MKKKKEFIVLVILLASAPFMYSLFRRAEADRVRERAELGAQLAVAQRLADDCNLEIQHLRDSLKNCKGR